MAAAIRQPDSLAVEELLTESARKRPRSPAALSRRLFGCTCTTRARASVGHPRLVGTFPSRIGKSVCPRSSHSVDSESPRS